MIKMACYKNSKQVLEDHKWVVYILPCVLAIVCYINGLRGEFVHDDIFAISNNADVTGQNQVMELFKNDFWGTRMDHVSSHKSYRPLCVLTFRLDYLISGGSPTWFHMVNTSLHVLVTLTFTFVCLQVLHTSVLCALFASSLFAVHPIHTEAVTGLVGRADVLAGLCFLLSFCAYSRSMQASSAKMTGEHRNKLKTSPNLQLEMWTPQIGYLVLSLLLSGAAMLCKETGVTVLGVSLIFDLLVNGRVVVRGVIQRQFSMAGTLCLIRCTSLVLTGAVLLVLRLWMMNFEQPHVFPEEANPASFSPSVLTRFLTFMYLPTFNLWLLLCPTKLSYDWAGCSIPLLKSFRDTRNLSSLVFYSTSLILLVKWLRRVAEKKNNTQSTSQSQAVLLLMSADIMAVPFLPASNIFFRVGFVVAERVLYIPSMGYCLMISQAVISLSCNLPQVRSRLFTLYIVLLLVMSLRTIDRNQVWQSRHDLFWSGVRTLPHNDKVHYNLANLLKDEGHVGEAEDHYRIAINLNPGIASYHMNLGTLLTNTTEAQLCYKEALRLRPKHTGALVNMGSLLLNKGDQSGISLIRQALAIDPKYFEAVLTMAFAMLANEDLAEAGKYSKEALLLRPDSAKAHLCRGIYLQNIGQTGTALQEYQTTLRLDPLETTALLNSARIFFTSGELEEAKTHLERAVGVDRNCSECLALLGSVYSKQGQGQHAVITLGNAASLAPNNTHTNLKYVQALKESRQSDKAWSVLKELMLRFHQSLDVLKFAFMLAMEENRHTEAVQYSQEMVRLAQQTGDSSLSSFYRNQGDAHRRNNDTASALKSLEKAVELNSSFVEAIIDAGSIHFLQKNYAKAESYYLQALRLDNKNSLANFNLNKLRNIYPGKERNKR